MQNKTVFIRESPFKIFKRFLFLWLMASPLLIMVFGEVQDNPLAEKDNGKMQQVFLWIYLLYSFVLLVVFMLRLLQSLKKSVIRLDENGITFYEKDFFAWKDIYDFRIGKKFLSYDVLTSGGNTSGKREVEEQKILVINGKAFRIKEQFLKFNLSEIAEIIHVYKQRLSGNKI